MTTAESASLSPQPDGGGARGGRARVLVAEKIGDSGIELLKQHFDVELGVGWSREEIEERIGDYDGVLIRSATKLDAPLIARAVADRSAVPRNP